MTHNLTLSTCRISSKLTCTCVHTHTHCTTQSFLFGTFSMHLVEPVDKESCLGYLSCQLESPGRQTSGRVCRIATVRLTGVGKPATHYRWHHSLGNISDHISGRTMSWVPASMSSVFLVLCEQLSQASASHLRHDRLYHASSSHFCQDALLQQQKRH